MSAVMPFLRRWWGYARLLLGQFSRTRASLAAGGLAFFVALSIAPAAVALGSLAGIFLDPDQVRAALDSLAAHSPGSIDQSQSLVNALVGLVESSSTGSFTVTTVASVLLAVYAASRVVLGMRQALNSTFDVVETRSGLIERGIAAVATLVGLVVGVGIVILLTVLPQVLAALGVDDVRVTTGWWVADWLIVTALVFLAVKAVLHRGPNGARRVPWTSPGVALATVWIVAVTAGVGAYAAYSTTLGAAVLVFGTAVVILLWLYLCFLGVLWGGVIEHQRQQADDEAATRRTSEAVRPPGP